MQAYIQFNWLHVLDADKKILVLDAESVSAYKVF